MLKCFLVKGLDLELNAQNNTVYITILLFWAHISARTHMLKSFWLAAANLYSKEPPGESFSIYRDSLHHDETLMLWGIYSIFTPVRSTANAIQELAAARLSGDLQVCEIWQRLTWTRCSLSGQQLCAAFTRRAEWLR